MQVIIYSVNDSVRVIFPNLNSGLTIDEIANKDVPEGAPYFIKEYDDLPTEPQQCWSLSPDGVIFVDAEKLNTFIKIKNEDTRNDLISEAKSTISLWQTELQIGIISDANKGRLTAWIHYINELIALDISQSNVLWPDKPE